MKEGKTGKSQSGEKGLCWKVEGSAGKKERADMEKDLWWSSG